VGMAASGSKLYDVEVRYRAPSLSLSPAKGSDEVSTSLSANLVILFLPRRRPQG
jgi:hypothetical protein